MKRFTWIELVVVLGAIALMFFLFAPQLSKAKPKAAYYSCMSNLKQLGNAGALYEGENQAVRPGPQPLGNGIPEVSWDRPLAIQMGSILGPAGVHEPVANLTKNPVHPFAKTLMVFTCPVDPQVQGAAIGSGAKTLSEGLAPGNNITRTYVLNIGSGNLVLGVEDGICFTADAIPVSKIKTPAGTVNLIENQGYATVFGQKNLMGDTVMSCSKTGILDPADSYTNPGAPMIHKDKKRNLILALMYDGYVEVLDQVDIKKDKGKIMQYVK